MVKKNKVRGREGVEGRIVREKDCNPTIIR